MITSPVGRHRVFSGGSWRHNTQNARLEYHVVSGPSYQEGHMGLRLARRAS